MKTVKHLGFVALIFPGQGDPPGDVGVDGEAWLSTGSLVHGYVDPPYVCTLWLEMGPLLGQEGRVLR